MQLDYVLLCYNIAPMFKLRFLLLSAFLLLSQSGLLLHELDVEHYGTAHAVCEICLSSNGLDGSLDTSQPAVLSAAYWNANRPQLTSTFSSRPSAHYQSRAPPSA